MIKNYLIVLFILAQSCANPKVTGENKKNNNINETVVVGVDSAEKEQLVLNQGPSMDPVSRTKKTQATKVLGIFLTGGTYRAFAYPEILNEFDKSSIKVHLISGYEMGALVAALFAKYGSAREIEWRIFKLKNDLKESSPFSRNWLEALNKFIDSTFKDDGIQDFKIVLALPVYDKQNKKYNFIKRGRTSDVLKEHFKYFYLKSLSKEQSEDSEIDLAGLSLDIPIVIKSSGEDNSFIPKDPIEGNSLIKVSLNQNIVERILFLDTKNQSVSDLKNLAEFIQRNKPATKVFVNNLMREMKNEENHY